MTLTDLEKLIENRFQDFKLSLKTELLKSNSSALSVPNSSEFNALKQEIENIKLLLKTRQGTIDVAEKKYDLKFQFKTFETPTLVVDKVQEVDTRAEVLEKAFAGVLETVSSSLKDKCIEYPWKKEIINEKLSLRQWITAPTGIFNQDAFKTPEGKFATGYPKSNVFNTAKPEYLDTFLHNYEAIKDEKNPKKWERKPAPSAQVALGTGSGKSTFFLRCLAFRQWSDTYLENNPDIKAKLIKALQLGASLIVPFDALITGLMESHNEWLSDETSDDIRVPECLICHDKENPDPDNKGHHVRYKMTHNEPAELVNIFTLKEAIIAYDKKRVDGNGLPFLKDPIVFDEAHMDDPAYREWIDIMEKKKFEPWDPAKVNKPNYNKRWFNIVKMSATFTDLPVSRYLSGKIQDWSFGSFKKLMEVLPDFFKEKVLIFCDKPSTPIVDEKGNVAKLPAVNFDVLRKAGIKFKDFTKPGLKAYAKKLLNSVSKPFLAFVNDDYETGISFGVPMLNCISTGRAIRKIRKNDKEFIDVPGKCDKANSLQQRGRLSRFEKFPTNNWAAAFEDFGTFIGKLNKDWVAEKIRQYYVSTPAQETQAKDFQSVLKALGTEPELKLTPEEIAQREKEDKENFELILVGELTKTLSDHAKLFTVLTEENEEEIMKAKKSEASKKGKKFEIPTKDGKPIKFGREEGEYFITTPLVKHLDTTKLPEYIKLATQPIIEQLKTVANYPWVATKKILADDFIFPKTQTTDAEAFGFLFQAHLENQGYELKTDLVRLDDEKKPCPSISIIFKDYKIAEYEKVLTGESAPLVAKHWDK